MAIEVKFKCESCSYSLPFRKHGFCPSCGAPILEVKKPEPAPKPKAKKKAPAKKKPVAKKKGKS